MSITGWSAIIFLGLFPTVIGYVFWYVALAVLKASELSIYLYFVPVLSTIFSYLIFQEEITAMFVFGGALVIIGLYTVNRQQRKLEQQT